MVLSIIVSLSLSVLPAALTSKKVRGIAINDTRKIFLSFMTHPTQFKINQSSFN